MKIFLILNSWHMKVITWNCNGAFRKKSHTVDNLNADLIIVQECEDPSRADSAYKEWAGDYLWIGDNKHRGIGVFSRSGLLIEKLDWPDNGLQLFLPFRVNNLINIVAVWTKQTNSHDFRYIGQLWKYLQLHRDKIIADKAIICGDFNSNKQWDGWHIGSSHSDVVRELREINMRSIYHEFTGDEQGKERSPTYFMQRKLNKPYHIDYAFVSNSMHTHETNAIEIGSPNLWLEYSDHMPFIFTIAG